jgi:hypothetical protein
MKTFNIYIERTTIESAELPIVVPDDWDEEALNSEETFELLQDSTRLQQLFERSSDSEEDELEVKSVSLLCDHEQGFALDDVFDYTE